MNKPRGKITHVYTRNDALARANEEEQKRVGTDEREPGNLNRAGLISQDLLT